MTVKCPFMNTYHWFTFTKPSNLTFYVFYEISTFHDNIFTLIYRFRKRSNFLLIDFLPEIIKFSDTVQSLSLTTQFIDPIFRVDHTRPILIHRDDIPH